MSKKEVVLLGNGTSVEVSLWTRDRKYFHGQVSNSSPTIYVYLPVSYLASNIVKPKLNNKRKNI